MTTKTMRLPIFGMALAGATILCAAVPEVGNVTMVQSSTSREVTISYTLANAPAVVTLDIETNGPNGWVSIGGENIQCFSADSDVWKKVSGKDEYVIKWHPDLSWPDHKIADGGARAVVTAWADDNTPDYMVVDLTATGGPGTERYYPAVEFLPGGVLKNPVYRTTSIVMRKIMAKGVTWTMGSVSEDQRQDDETTHLVTLDRNYYIGIFEVTQSQWNLVKGNNPSEYKGEGYSMHPVEQVSYQAIRNKDSETQNFWPNDPGQDSFLYKLREKTGIVNFDLPGEAQWEFASRAGYGEGFWGTGKPYVNAWSDPNVPGNVNGAVYIGKTTTVGSYDPNAWGIYDMSGNVLEVCNDWYEADITTNNGAVNVDQTTPTLTLGGATGTGRVERGGSCMLNVFKARSAYRTRSRATTSITGSGGFRLMCYAGLK